LPFLKKLLDNNLKFSLCLGSSNYLCRVRYEETFDLGLFQNLIEESKVEQFHDFVKDVFLDKLEGNIYEPDLNLRPAFWSLVSRNSEGCPAKRCNYFSDCNYYRTKTSWEKSRILIANHHLLLYHLLNDKRTLPSYGAIIIDEAHGFLKTGFSIFTLSYSGEILQDYAKQFERAVSKVDSLPGEAREEFTQYWASAQNKWELFFSNWEVELNLTFEADKIEIIEKFITFDYSDLIVKLEQIRNKTDILEESIEDAALLNQILAAKKFLDYAIQFVTVFNLRDLKKYVYWGEKRNNKVTLHCCNLQLSQELEEGLIEPTVWTSATLGYWGFSSVPRSKKELIQRGYFQSFLDQVVPRGLELAKDSEIDIDIFFSPFNFAKQTALYIPRDLKMPAWQDAAGQEKYEDDLLDEIVRLSELSNGGVLVLFTSHYLLQNITFRIRELLDLDVFSQTELGAAAALKEFKESPNSVLLGTTSFWQGIDISGSTLRMLIITKLMFTPPADPIFKARSKLLESQKRKPFFDLALPEASMMLRQAFGRLIRNESDTGVVAILDNRMITKTYGRVLLSNLPSVPLIQNFDALMSFTKKHDLLSH